MASCQQCNNLLPRTVDRCPVCGLVPPSEIPNAEFAPPQSPGWAPAAPSLGDRLKQTPGAPNVGTPASPPAPAPTPAPTEFQFNEPLAQPTPGTDHQDPAVAADYQPPAAQLGTLEAANYKRVGAPSGHVAPVPNPELQEQIIGNLPSDFMPDQDDTLRDRTVRAQSARIEGVSIGRSENHKVLTGAMFGLGLLALAAGTLLSIPLLDDTEAAAAAPTFEGVDEDGELVLAESSEANMVEVRAQGCSRTDVSYAFMPDPTIVVLPYSQVLNDGVPTIRDGEGNEVLADLIYADGESDLAVLRARSEIDAAGLGWSGASQATEGATLLLVETSRSGEPTATSVQVVSRSRNNAGLISTIVVSETGMKPGSVALDAQGRLVGIVDKTGDALTSADALRQLVGEAKSRPGNYDAICPEPEAELTVDLDN